MSVEASEIAIDTPLGQLPPRNRRVPPPAVGVAALVVAANLCVGSGLQLVGVVPVIGLSFLVGLPVALLVVKVRWTSQALVERVGYSLATTLLLLIGGGLAVNTAYAAGGAKGALKPIPILVLGDLIVGSLLLWRRRELAWQPSRRLASLGFSLRDKTVTRLASTSVVAAVIGAIRLNNNAGGFIALTALCMVSLSVLLLFVWRERLDPAAMSFAIYAVTFAMLLATSMRGWYTTGHDIQTEYWVFELTKTNGNWDITRFINPYNACLSITILPTMLWDVTRIPDIYVFKVLFQAIFALCPVLVYRLSCRFTTKTISLIAVTYLLCFPTFADDMPFLNRQEIAFLFILAALLVMTDETMLVPKKRLWIAAFSVGVIVSHYSSALIYIATLVTMTALGWLFRRSGQRLASIGARLHLPETHLEGDKRARPVVGGLNLVGVLNLIVLLAGAFLWIGVITGTGTHIARTFKSAASSITQTFSFNQKSSDVGYNLFSFSQPNNDTLLSQYRLHTIAEVKNRNGYLPLAAVNAQAPTPALSIDEPLSSAGRALSSEGIDVSGINAVLRSGSAKLLQLSVGIGLVGALLRRDSRFRIKREPYLFAVATLLVLVVSVVVPVVSENYGVLRVFIQGLLVLSPLLAYGTVVLFSFLGTRWGMRAAMALAILFFLDLTGLVPQIVGGYQQQLSLNNSGLYYNVYYPHTQEIAAMEWIGKQIQGVGSTGLQAEVETDKYQFRRLKLNSGINPINDIYPTLLRKHSFVFLGFATVRYGVATAQYKGNLINYTYPLKWLQNSKDLIFSDGGSEVFR